MLFCVLTCTEKLNILMSESDISDYINTMHRIKERLIIIFDHKLPRKEELNEADEFFCKAMHKAWRMIDELEAYSKPDFNPEDVTEQLLF